MTNKLAHSANLLFRNSNKTTEEQRSQRIWIKKINNLSVLCVLCG